MLWSSDDTGGATEPVLLTGRGLTLRDFVRVTEQHVPGCSRRRGGKPHGTEPRSVGPLSCRGATHLWREHRLWRPQRHGSRRRGTIAHAAQYCLSHTCGTGPDLEEEIVRGMLLLKANTLAAGLSGVRFALVEVLVAWLNRGLSPCIPAQGSVGSQR